MYDILKNKRREEKELCLYVQTVILQDLTHYAENEGKRKHGL